MDTDKDKIKRDAPAGILRQEAGKSRRTSLEFKFLAQGEPASPQPSVDRLSVTFAEDSVRSDSSKCNYFTPPPLSAPRMDKVHFPQAATDGEDSDEEDYSASVNAIIQRRASTRKSRRRSTRRASSPFSPDILPGSENGRRRSSVFTTSSGDTAITMDENLAVGEVTQEEIFENIKLHKEVLSNVKMQPWNMRKKLKLVVQAKSYVKKHEGALQERLAQSHSTRDMLARWNILIIKKWQRYRREMANLSNWFIPWELKIKEIESHFGSVVASYFIFLRWLFWVNTVLSVVLISFVAVPELLTADHQADRKSILPEEKYNSTNFLTLWDFEGMFKYSPLFYGWYTNRDSNIRGYRLPFAYFVTGLVVYAYSFFATLRKMAENSRMSKLSEKDDECIFSWKLFTAWDYMIGNAETAHNRVASIVVGFKEALLEEAEKKRESRNWKITGFRILVNTVVLGLLFFSAFAVVMVVKRSTELDAGSTVWRRNEITVVMSLISLFFPMIFEVLGLLEQYHPRKQLRLQLARIMVLNLLNLYSLIFALFDKINDMTAELEEFKNRTAILSNTDVMISTAPLISNTTFQAYSASTSCYEICSDSSTLPSIITTIAANYSAALQKIVTASTQLTTESSTPALAQNFTASYEYPTGVRGDNFTKFYENFNVTSSNFTDTDIQDNFIDYLTYILYDFVYNITTSNITEDLNLINISSTTLDDFKATLSPYFRTTEDEFDDRFDNRLSTLYDEITTTISDLNFTIVKSITSENCTTICNETTTNYSTDTPKPIPTLETLIPTTIAPLNYSTRSRLRSLCWETMFGQELIKLTVMDLVITILSTLAMDFARGIFVRVMNRCWCWDLEKKFPQYGDFKVAENILHLVNNQGMVWMGLFFSPGLVVLNVVKLYAMMYFRAWAVLTCNVPHEIIFRASRSNNFYYALLLMMLFLCVLPVGYAIVWIRPSHHCGPFSNYSRIFKIFTTTIKNAVPEPIEKALDYIASPGIVIPLLVLLILIIYYLVSLTGALREANNDLKIQLRRERTEERRKMFQIADRRLRRGGSGGSGEFSNTPFAKWKKLLSNMPSGGKSFDETPKQESNDPPIREENNKNKDFFSKLIKKALGKSSTSEEDNQNNQDDGTDTEQHESLPEDLVSIKEVKPQVHNTGRLSISSGSSAANIWLQKRNNSIKKAINDNERHGQRKDSNPQVLPHHQHRRDTFDLKKNRSTRDMSQDSGSSVWSENIPVITISKTESAECLDEKDGTTKKEIIQKEEIKFKPKIKCVLKKQTTEIDEDVICHFSKDLGECSGKLFDERLEELHTKSESSEDTGREGSVDTVLASPNVVETRNEDEKMKSASGQRSSTNGSATESSSGYNEATSL